MRMDTKRNRTLILLGFAPRVNAQKLLVMAQFGFLFSGVTLREAIVQAERRACPERLSTGKKRMGSWVKHRRCARDPIRLLPAHAVSCCPQSTMAMCRSNYCPPCFPSEIPVYS